MVVTAFHIPASMKQRLEEFYPAIYKSFGEAVRDGLREIIDWLEEFNGIKQEMYVIRVKEQSKMQIVSFKMPSNLLKYIKKLSVEEGVSLSEFLRSCVSYTLRRRYKAVVKEI